MSTLYKHFGDTMIPYRTESVHFFVSADEHSSYVLVLVLPCVQACTHHAL